MSERNICFLRFSIYERIHTTRSIAFILFTSLILFHSSSSSSSSRSSSSSSSSTSHSEYTQSTHPKQSANSLDTIRKITKRKHYNIEDAKKQQPNIHMKDPSANQQQWWRGRQRQRNYTEKFASSVCDLWMYEIYALHESEMVKCVPTTLAAIEFCFCTKTNSGYTQHYSLIKRAIQICQPLVVHWINQTKTLLY